MREWTCWAFNVVAFLAMRFVAGFPVLGVGILLTCVVLTVLSFTRGRNDPGDPALGFVASLIFWTTVYAVLAYPRIVLNDVAYALVYAGCFGGLALHFIWIFRKAWRKRQAKEARAKLLDEA